MQSLVCSGQTNRYRDVAYKDSRMGLGSRSQKYDV